MPSNITLNSGTGGERLTVDQIVEAGVTVQAQYIKLLGGGAGVTAAVPGDAADGLYVQLRNVSGAIKVSAVGNVLVSAAGHILVSGDGTFAVAGKVTAVADTALPFWVATSADRTVLVSAAGTQLVSGIVSVQGSVLVSAAGTQLVSGIVTVQGNVQVSAAGTQLVSGIVTVQGNVAVSAAGHVLVSGDGTFLVRGLVTVVADPQATFFVATSGNRFVCVHPNLSGSASPMSANGTFQPLEYVYINASAAGDLTLIAATAGRSVRVIGYTIVSTSAMQVFFQDTEATSAPKVHAAFTLVTGGGVSYAGSIFAPAFQTTVGTGLELKRGVTVDSVVQGHLTYIHVSN